MILRLPLGVAWKGNTFASSPFFTANADLMLVSFGWICICCIGKPKFELIAFGADFFRFFAFSVSTFLQNYIIPLVLFNSIMYPQSISLIIYSGQKFIGFEAVTSTSGYCFSQILSSSIYLCDFGFVVCSLVGQVILNCGLRGFLGSLAVCVYSRSLHLEFVPTCLLSEVHWCCSGDTNRSTRFAW